MPSVYVETTIPSYLTAAPSRDLIVAGHQQITHTWWQTAKERFELFISEAVCRRYARAIRGSSRRWKSCREFAVLP